MNPFELPGPQFLAFYAALGIFVLGALWLAQRSAEGGLPPPAPVSDPYVMAYLRGGAKEAVRTAFLVLIDRQFLEVSDDDVIATNEKGARGRPVNALERKILEILKTPASAGEAVKDVALLMLAEQTYQPELARLGLLPDDEIRARRVRVLIGALAVLLIVAGIKVVGGASRGRPVGYLVIIAVAFSAVAIPLTLRFRTALGDRLLADLRELFWGLKERAAYLRPHVSTGDLALTVALFGVSGLPEVAYPHARKLIPKVESWGSSCGSNTCGSGCGGGGCGGGCGGCGG